MSITGKYEMDALQALIITSITDISNISIHITTCGITN